MQYPVPEGFAHQYCDGQIVVYRARLKATPILHPTVEEATRERTLIIQFKTVFSAAVASSQDPGPKTPQLELVRGLVSEVVDDSTPIPVVFRAVRDAAGPRSSCGSGAVVARGSAPGASADDWYRAAGSGGCGAVLQGPTHPYRPRLSRNYVSAGGPQRHNQQGHRNCRRACHRVPSPSDSF